MMPLENWINLQHFLALKIDFYLINQFCCLFFVINLSNLKFASLKFAIYCVPRMAYQVELNLQKRARYYDLKSVTRTSRRNQKVS